MQFLQPILLWGLLGICIPILIHLWRGKKGQVMYWAAMHWLSTQESSVAKGVRLENILVLLLRILMLVLLVFLLSQVFIPSLSKVSEERIIHLVQPSIQISQEYKFELQQALEKDEELYWADENLTEIEDLDELNLAGRTEDIQAALNQIPYEATQLNLYLSNSQNNIGSKNYLSKIKPRLFLGSADLKNSSPQVISIDGIKTMELNQNGLLDSIADDQSSADGINLEERDFAFYMGNVSTSERLFIKASLEAIQDVYGFDFVENEELDEAKLVFDHELPKGKDSEKLYIISNNFTFSEQANLVSFSDELDFEHSELVQTGKLPEVILERFLAYSGLEQQDVKLSQTQLESRFLVDKPKNQNKKANLNLILIGLFLLCYAAERYFANKQAI
ncbi:BatA domain-containing protein [Algoriphagus chordae]|uniref:Putative membrane protein (TIGR02226 family) n=1 Tax=Algoriphagus chordae TaxID=237019 RepID=A0A2W7SXR1_9BACT|nr:BatA domain-containing protein [Algoriphagus chordae]PZX55592.1 putative membrane protein (TIGR02226 family) [Algoriphagus chordae]